MRKSILNILKPIIAAIISLLALYKLNVFDYLTFIPNEYRYEVGITVYFAFFEILIETIFDCIGAKLFSNLDIVISSKNTFGDLTSTPQIDFNSMQIAEMFVKISATGTKKQFAATAIKIPCPSFVTMQVNEQNAAAVIDPDGDCIINLQRLFGNIYERTQIDCEFIISFIREPVSNAGNVKVRPIIVSSKKVTLISKLIIRYKTNSFILNLKEGNSHADYALVR